MMAKAIVDIVVDNPDNLVQQVFDVIGNPFVALLTAVVVAMFTFGKGSGMDREGIMRRSPNRSRPSRASC